MDNEISDAEKLVLNFQAFTYKLTPVRHQIHNIAEHAAPPAIIKHVDTGGAGMATEDARSGEPRTGNRQHSQTTPNRAGRHGQMGTGGARVAEEDARPAAPNNDEGGNNGTHDGDAPPATLGDLLANDANTVAQDELICRHFLGVEQQSCLFC